MGQVAFDTQEFVEKLESSGLNREQAKAITLVVRQSHEVADLATKRDLEDVRKDLTVQIADVRKDMDTRFEKNEAQMQARFEQLDKRLDFAEKRFDRLEIKFDRLQWFLLAGILSLLFKDVLPKLWGG
ncbi:coiled-coil domain-containing protein [Symbiopectobacterium sp. RP]|uniref:coiled-coil domain-containing protein n=1 Tax=Symbiopectobacterium sp. RP TaxID=3248553 RepID=UPI003D2D5864